MILKRIDYNYSRQEVADILGLTSNVVARIEKEALAKIEKALEGLELE